VHGGSIEALAGLLTCTPDAGTLTNAERGLLDFVAEVNRGGEAVNPATVEGLRNHGWADLQIAEAIHLTALFATFNRVVNAFGLPSRQLLADTDLLSGQTSPSSKAGPFLVGNPSASPFNIRSRPSGDVK
jgi:hypothetical protein